MTKTTAFKLPQVLSLKGLLSLELPPLRPVISPWLNSGESCLLWAGTGMGKSMLAQTLALAVAGGGKVLGWSCPEPAKVLYVDGEQSVRDIRGRFTLLASTITGSAPEKAAANLTLMSRAAQENPGGFLDIADEHQHRAFLDYVKKEGFGLVVLDNLTTLTDTIQDENSAAAMKPMQTLLTHLKKQNVAVLLVHHAGKDPKKFRGSSALATTFERILGVVRNENAPATRIDATVTLEKFRDKVPEGFRPMFPVVFTSALGADGKEQASWSVGDSLELETAWTMFASGAYPSRAAFVAAFNQRFAATRVPSNFPRDFAKRWQAELGKTPQEIVEIDTDLRRKRKCPSPSKDPNPAEAA